MILILPAFDQSKKVLSILVATHALLCKKGDMERGLGDVVVGAKMKEIMSSFQEADSLATREKSSDSVFPRCWNKSCPNML